MTHARVTVSIVSHGQNTMVNALLADLRLHCKDDVIAVLTENVQDKEPLRVEDSAVAATLLVNQRVKGFGANHNTAFARCATPYYCVCNPDVRLSENPFPALIGELERSGAGVVGSMVRDPEGEIQDSARAFPTFTSLARRFDRGSRGPDYRSDGGAVDVDWVAGMFMLFPTQAFRAVGGFDERYFMYYEDADICRRLHRLGMRVRYDPTVAVVHNARRASRRNLRLAAHHAASIVRFLYG